MQIIGWLRRRTEKIPHMPAVFRLRHPEGLRIQAVDVDGTFHPNGRRVRGRRQAADGLCMISWPVDAQRLDVTFRVQGAEASVEMRVDRAQPALAVEVALDLPQN